MRIPYIFFILLFYNNIAFAENKIVYLDVQFVIDNSELGKFYKKKIKKIKDKNKIDLKKDEVILKDKENEIKNQKNILSKEEINNRIKDLNELLKKYQIKISDNNKIILNQKKKYSSEILKILNPIVANYVNTNNITLVIDKKNVLIGIKSLDITDKIIQILNDQTKEQNLLNEN
tara:strand:- start:1443 stop:1967 length:525 start_codon:yes stop_codon:yes gene_type:complete